jgi:hypothetical protein
MKLLHYQNLTSIITKNHSTAIRGHKSATKIIRRIKNEYSWPYMKQDIPSFIKNDKNCQ